MSRRPRIGDHDLDVKMAQAEKHFEKGYKARAARYRGSCLPLRPFATGVSTAWSAADAEAFAAQVRFLVNLRKPNERDAGQQILDRVRERMEPLAKVRRVYILYNCLQYDLFPIGRRIPSSQPWAYPCRRRLE